MTKTFNIPIEGLPEGWKPVAYGFPVNGDYYFDGVSIKQAEYNFNDQVHRAYLIVEKIQPRRIVLEETEEDNLKYTTGFYANQSLGNGIYIADQPKIWREVKEGE